MPRITRQQESTSPAAIWETRLAFKRPLMLFESFRGKAREGWAADSTNKKNMGRGHRPNGRLYPQAKSHTPYNWPLRRSAVGRRSGEY